MSERDSDLLAIIPGVRDMRIDISKGPIKRPPKVPLFIEAIEAAGFLITMDWDGTMQYVAPPDVSVAKLVGFLEEHREGAERQLMDRHQINRRRFIGGPLNGERHNKWCWCGIAAKLSRGRWAAYKVVGDGRAFFVGEATNEKAAMKMAKAYRQPTGKHVAP